MGIQGWTFITWRFERRTGLAGSFKRIFFDRTFGGGGKREEEVRVWHWASPLENSKFYLPKEAKP